MPDYQLALDFQTEPRVAKTQNYMVGQKKLCWEGGETANTFLIWGTIGVEKKNTYWEGGTPHILC